MFLRLRSISIVTIISMARNHWTGLAAASVVFVFSALAGAHASASFEQMDARLDQSMASLDRAIASLDRSITMSDKIIKSLLEQGYEVREPTNWLEKEIAGKELEPSLTTVEERNWSSGGAM